MCSRTSPADPFIAATLEGHPLLLYHICHLCAGDLDPPVHLQHHQPPSSRQDAPSEREALRTQQDIETQEIYWRPTNPATSGGTGVSEGRLCVHFWLQEHWAGSPGAVTSPWGGCCHRQQRRRPLLQLPSQRSMWKQSLRQWPRLLLHCWLSERPLAAGERGQETWLEELEPTQSPQNLLGIPLVLVARQWDVLSWQQGDSAGSMVRIRCARRELLHPASTRSLLRTGLGETARFGLAVLS